MITAAHEIEWTEPPPMKHLRWADTFAELMARPGCWGVIRHYKPSSAKRVASAIRAGRQTSLPPGRWDAAARQADLYVCYLGPEERRRKEVGS